MKTHGELAVQYLYNDHSDKIKSLVSEFGTEKMPGFDFCQRFSLENIANAESKERHVVFVLLHVNLHIHKTDKAEYIIITRENLVL